MYEYCLAHIWLYVANKQIKNLIMSHVFYFFNQKKKHCQVVKSFLFIIIKNPKYPAILCQCNPQPVVEACSQNKWNTM